MKQWMIKRNGADLDKIAKRYGISEIMAEVLVKRGLHTWEDMDKYLYPDEKKMYSGAFMKDMGKAVEILRTDIREKKKIGIIGDYDVDGIMSTSILYLGLQAMGADVVWRIPHRVRDGYGIRPYMVEEAKEQGVATLITCDNGISAVDAVEKAKELGMRIIITDHHEVPRNVETGREVIPEADAVIDPKQSECEYPWKELCGSGVAYKVMEQLWNGQWKENLRRQLLSFAAIATVCDVVPLLDENRIIVKHGLEILQHSDNLGLGELIRQLEFHRKITSGDLGFRIGPCLNAAGRLEDAAKGVELLLETVPQKAEKLAEELILLNEERKEMTAEAVEEAEKQIVLDEKNENMLPHVLVIYLENCHESIAGIVAGRIREKYYRPTMILTRSGNHFKGSGRSIPGYHMQQELNRCSSLLLEYGGHAMAAGFSLKTECLERLREELNRNCTLKEEEFVEKVSFDREVPLEQIDNRLVQELELLQPVGEQNVGALFAKRGIELCSVRVFGKEKQIGRFQGKDNGRKYTLIDFRIDLHLKQTVCSKYSESAWQELLEGRGEGCLVDVLYVPEINERYGDIQYRIIDCR